MRTRDFGEALKLIMEERGWSQTRLGRVLGHGQTWVSRVIRGEIDPGIRAARDYLAKVGWELHITPKAEEDDPVRRREFVAGAASVMFVRSPKTTPFHDPAYVDQLTQRAIQVNNETGGGLQTPEMSDETRAYLNCLLARGIANSPGREKQARVAIERALGIDTLPTRSSNLAQPPPARGATPLHIVQRPSKE